MAPPSKEAILRGMRRLFKHYIRRCRGRNIYWELSLELFHKLTSAHCHYCGRGPQRKIKDYPYNGIDRVNDKKGYTPDNSLPCCTECNFIKGGRLTYDEMKAVGEALRLFRQRRS